MQAPPLIRDIAKHPVLSKVHLIAEPWDLGMYQVSVRGSLPGSCSAYPYCIAASIQLHCCMFTGSPFRICAAVPLTEAGQL